MGPTKKPYKELKKVRRITATMQPLGNVNVVTIQKNKSAEATAYRVKHTKARRARGIDGKGGKDLSQTTKGTFVREDPSKNRARNRSKLTIG